MKLSADTLRDLYASRRFLDSETRRQLGLKLRIAVHYKDPLVAKENPGLAIDRKFYVSWEPGLGDGPTSARFAVVDYDSTTNVLVDPAKWDDKNRVFREPGDKPAGKVIDENNLDSPQFKQVSTWAILQNTLSFFEGSQGLGRRISWAFEGSRLLVVPNAGYGANAYYDRESHSLQFYYFDDADGNRIYTCLSSDIVNHEFAHALLDGIRPHYYEAVSPQTAAFHEFIGDLNAILMTLQNSDFRKELAKRTGGLLEGKSGSELLSSVATQFGRAVNGQNYLRTADNGETMSTMGDEIEPHELSKVLTGAMFDIVIKFAAQYVQRESDEGKNISPANALHYTTQRMQVIAIQSLDLLPPVEVTFADYARAVLRNLLIADPTDPRQYRNMIADVFVKRDILTRAEVDELLLPTGLYERMPGEIPYDPVLIASSRAEAYRYLDDNRDALFIPRKADIIVDEVFSAEKMADLGLRLPRQVIVQYLWREELILNEDRFGEFRDRSTTLLCGGTMVLDENGSMLSWVRKPGGDPSAKAEEAEAARRAGKKLNGVQQAAYDEWQAGMKRRGEYLNALARRIAEGMVGQELGGPNGLVGAMTPPLVARQEGGQVRFELSPHFHIHDDDAGRERGDPDRASLRGLKWRTSS